MPPNNVMPCVYANAAQRVNTTTPPTDVRIVAVTSASITLSWTNPGPWVATNNTVLYGQACGQWIERLSTSGAKASWVVVGLLPGTYYCLAVQSWNVTLGSNLSSTVTATTSPQPGPSPGPGPTPCLFGCPTPSPDHNVTAAGFTLPLWQWGLIVAAVVAAVIIVVAWRRES